MTDVVALAAELLAIESPTFSEGAAVESPPARAELDLHELGDSEP